MIIIKICCWFMFAILLLLFQSIFLLHIKPINLYWKAVGCYASCCLTQSELTDRLSWFHREPCGVTDSHHLGFRVCFMMAPWWGWNHPTWHFLGSISTVHPCMSVFKAHYPPLRRVIRKIRSTTETSKQSGKNIYIFRYTIDVHKSLVWRKAEGRERGIQH